MSQQGNDNKKKDLRNQDEQRSQNPIGDNENGKKGLESTNEGNTREDAFSKAAGQNLDSPEEENDHLESAMLQETHSSALRAKSQEKEKEYSRGHLEESAGKNDENSKKEAPSDKNKTEKEVKENPEKPATPKENKSALSEAKTPSAKTENSTPENKIPTSELPEDKEFEENSVNPPSKKGKTVQAESKTSEGIKTEISSEDKTTISETKPNKVVGKKPVEESSEEKDNPSSVDSITSKKVKEEPTSEDKTTTTEIPSKNKIEDSTSEKDKSSLEETPQSEKKVVDLSTEDKLTTKKTSQDPLEMPGNKKEAPTAETEKSAAVEKKKTKAAETPAEEPSKNPPQGPPKNDPDIEEDIPATPVKEPGTSPSPKEEPDRDEKHKTAGKKNVHSEFEDSVAEDSEDETATERHGIEKKDYHSMSKEDLVKELEKLVKKEKIQAIKEHVEEIKTEFNAKFDEELEEKKEEFLADGGNLIDFHYSTPLKKQFNSVYFDYKEKRNKYYQQLKQDLNQNLGRRLEIIEELKGLLDVEENINTTYKHFKELQDRWKTAGPIPRDKYNTVWNTYHHHVENFYDFLHLNREFRDLDFKHNLEQKLKVIDRAEELTQEEDTGRAFRELQMLHKMWKEEIGPVAKEYREDIWTRFSEATKKIHDLRQAYYDQLDQEFEKNLETKQEIILKIKTLAETNYTSHNQWQQKIKELESLRDLFFKAGKVPKEKNEETWNAFKQSVRQFNRNKNAYYKGLKKEQYENLEKKKELIKIAEEHKDSEDFKETTPLMKKIQMDWKKIGHVPRKDSDKVWKQFKAACNHYFDRLHKSTDKENAEELKAFEKKKEILDNLRTTEFSGEKKKDLPVIKEAIAEWKQSGKVPYNKRFIEGKFNKLLDQLFEKLDVDNTKAEMMKYENKIHALNEADDDKKLRNEHYFLTKKVEETKAEIRQLENNLQFFANVDDDNPLVQEVHKNIQDHKDQLKVWKEKLQKIKSLY